VTPLTETNASEDRTFRVLFRQTFKSKKSRCTVIPHLALFFKAHTPTVLLYVINPDLTAQRSWALWVQEWRSGPSEFESSLTLLSVDWKCPSSLACFGRGSWRHRNMGYGRKPIYQDTSDDQIFYTRPLARTTESPPILVLVSTFLYGAGSRTRRTGCPTSAPSPPSNLLVFLDVKCLEPKHPGLEAYYDTTKVRDSSDLLTAARGKECRPVQNLLFSECRLLAISEPLRRRLHRGVVPGRTPIPPAGCPPSSPPPCWRPPAWTIGPNNFFELAE
jgi:hypothetical protein